MAQESRQKKFRVTLEKEGRPLDIVIHADSITSAYESVEHQCGHGWKITDIKEMLPVDGNTTKASIELGKLIELTQEKIKEQWPEIIRDYEEDVILGRYCDWCNMRMKDYGADVVRPTKITTFRVWMRYNYPEYKGDVDRLFAKFQRNTEII